jgi:quercetin dioxygenase-like cupin family protein
MICRFRFAANLVTPEHSHPHEQMSIVVKGRVRFFIEGEERIASPGDILHFPPDCWHGATMMEEEVELIDIFSPIREDFLGG